jgi:hypothetical protein
LRAAPRRVSHRAKGEGRAVSWAEKARKDRELAIKDIPKGLTERRVQQDIAEYLAMAMPNNSYTNVIPAGDGRAVRAPGYEPGAPDLFVLYDSKFYGLEVKTETGRQSPNQKLAEQQIISAGGCYRVVRNIRDVYEFLTEHKIPLRVRITA